MMECDASHPAEEMTTIPPSQEVSLDPEVSVTAPSPWQYLYIHADSLPAAGVNNADSFFLKKTPLNIVKQELETILHEKGDTSPLGNYWILKQIDHWNNDHEMVIGLSDVNIYFLKYNFVNQKRRGEVVHIKLASITSITEGDITYPNYSAVERRDTRGMRVAWGDTSFVPLLQRWNPFCASIPYCIFANHPFFVAHPKDIGELERDRFDVSHFTRALLQTVQKTNSAIQLSREAIVIYCYVGASSLIFNQSQLGFSKDRNGMSF